MRNVADHSYREHQNTHFMFNKFTLLPSSDSLFKVEAVIFSETLATT
jgi:hypothetical protein